MVQERLAEMGREGIVEIEGHELRLTSLDRVLWPGVTKRDLIRYYLDMAPTLLDYLRDRPLTTIRFPEGVGGERIFQRHPSKGSPEFMRTVRIYSESNHAPRLYMVCENQATLAHLGQMSVLELHPWHSRTRKGQDSRSLGTDFDDPEGFEESVLNYPDYLVCDLDPNTPTDGFRRAAEVAKAARELFAEQGLESYVKTSGKRGVHVYVPLARQHDFDHIRIFADRIGNQLERRLDGLVNMELKLEKRPEGVFFDHSINSQGRSLAAAYSPRATGHGQVSFPLRWEELDDVSPEDFTLTTVPGLLKERGDAWGGFLAKCQKVRAHLA